MWIFTAAATRQISAVQRALAVFISLSAKYSSRNKGLLKSGSLFSFKERKKVEEGQKVVGNALPGLSCKSLESQMHCVCCEDGELRADGFYTCPMLFFLPCCTSALLL
jgi:hypothetical protein